MRKRLFIDEVHDAVLKNVQKGIVDALNSVVRN